MTPRACSAIVTAAVSIAVALGSSRAAADDKEACLANHLAGQALEKREDLLGAAAKFALCGREDACPAVVRSECVARRDAVIASTPGLLLDVRDPSGQPLVDARLLIDGRAVRDRLDGQVISVNPGARLVRVEPADPQLMPGEVEVHAQKGERSIRVVLQLVRTPFRPNTVTDRDETDVDCGGASGAPACGEGLRCRVSGDCEAGRCEAGRCARRATPAAPPTAQGQGPGPGAPVAVEAPSPTLALALLAVSAGGLATFAGFAISGRNRESDLRSCAPYCDHSAVDKMYRDYLVADIAGAVGLATGALGAWLLARALGGPSRAAARVAPFGLGASMVGRF